MLQMVPKLSFQYQRQRSEMVGRGEQNNLTSEHHHVLQIGTNLVRPPQIEKERERVNVARPGNYHSKLFLLSRRKICA